MKVHPVVLFSICDAYIRRNDERERVIGTLLGTVADGTVEIKNTYTVPHNENNDQVAVDIMHHKTLFDLSQKSSTRETLVGWFSTNGGISDSDSLIQDFYNNEAKNNHSPISIHLTVDTTFANNRMDIKAYTAKTLMLGDKKLATEFQEIPCEVLTVDLDRIGMDLISSEMTNKIPSDLESLDHSLAKLEEQIGLALEYVTDVVEERRAGDPVIGRHLAETVASIPNFSKEEFQRMMNEGVQDVMLMMYMSNLIKANIALADKLGTTQLPLT